jgi:hypothetical protein
VKKGRKLLCDTPLIKLAIAIPEQTYNVLSKEANKETMAVSQIIRRILIKYTKWRK